MASAILKAVKEYRSQKEFDGRVKDAVDKFEAQKAAIQGISKMPGFAVILEYLASEQEILNQRADTTENPLEWGIARANAMFCKNFMTFLTRLANAKDKA